MQQDSLRKPTPSETCRESQSACSDSTSRFASNSHNTNEVRDVLYVLCPSYSGSTLLTFLLAAHPGIATVGELKASAMGDIETYRCSCGALLRECAFWKRVKEGMQQSGTPFSFADFGTHFNRGGWVFRHLIGLSLRRPLGATVGLQVLALLPSCKSQLRNILEQNRRLIELITALQCGRVFLDGSKDPERLNQLQNSGHWNIKVIHLLRDGRGITNSYMQHYQVGMRAAAEEWVATERASERALSKFSSSDILRIKYEDLCRGTERTVAAAHRFVGLDPAPTRQRSAPSDLHILGNSMRLDFGNTVQLDEKWRNELCQPDLGVFESIAGARNRAHGYY